MRWFLYAASLLLLLVEYAAAGSVEERWTPGPCEPSHEVVDFSTDGGRTFFRPFVPISAVEVYPDGKIVVHTVDGIQASVPEELKQFLRHPPKAPMINFGATAAGAYSYQPLSTVVATPAP